MDPLDIPYEFRSNQYETSFTPSPKHVIDESLGVVYIRPCCNSFLDFVDFIKACSYFDEFAGVREIMLEEDPKHKRITLVDRCFKRHVLDGSNVFVIYKTEAIITCTPKQADRWFGPCPFCSKEAVRHEG